MSAAETAIRTTHLSRSYGPTSAVVHALRGVSLEVGRCERVALLGKSGSGKSTLLNLLGGLDRPTSGQVVVDGLDLARLSARHLARYRLTTVGMIFQSFNLIPNRTALQNVEIPMVYRDGHVDRGRAASALARVGLKTRAQHFATELSGGEQQRVAVARALINDPALILADEPTGNLDQDAGRAVMQLLEELHQEGRTILLVTHDDGVAAYARRELWLQDGKIVSDQKLPVQRLEPSIGDHV